MSAQAELGARDVRSAVTLPSGLGGLLDHPWLTVRAQLLLGIVFAAAALPKIADPPSFAHMIHNYRILPAALLNLSALVLPWLELLCGLCLILGVWRRTAAALVGALLVVFMVAIAINLARGNPIDCGCFDLSAAGKSVEERFADMRWVVMRDAGMLLLVFQILRATRVRPGDGAA